MKPNSPLCVFDLKELNVCFPLVADDFATCETPNGDDHDACRSMFAEDSENTKSHIAYHSI